MNLEFALAQLSVRASKTRAAFYEDLASALEDGIDIVSYLKKRADRAKQLRDPLGPIYRYWLRRMDSMTFSESMKGSGIPDSDIMVLSAAETGASLPDNLRFLAKSVREVAEMKKVIMGAVFAPSLVFLVIIGLIYGFSAYFVPVLTTIIPPEKWPAAGRFLYGVSQFAMGYGVLLLGVLIAAVAGLVISFNRFIAPVRRDIDNWPPYSLFRAYQGAITLVSLASLMAAGTSMIEALTRVSKSSGRWVQWHMRTITKRLDQFSGNPGKAFDTGLLPLRALNRVVDRAERSDFGAALQSIGLTILVDVRKDVEASAKLLNIIMLVFAGLTMAMLMFGFLDTVYSIRSSMQIR